MRRRIYKRPPRPPHRAGTADLARSSKFRLVSFRSQTARLAWGFLGALAIGGSLLLALPSFEENAPVPQPWNLWLSTNAPSEGGLNEPNWLLNMTMVADRSCRTATVTGSLQWQPKELNADPQLQPDRYILGVGGAHILSFESRDVDVDKPRLSRQWHTIPIFRVKGTDMIVVPAPFWPYSPITQAEFRFEVTAVHPAGFHSCYLTSPSMAKENNEDDYDPDPKVQRAVETFVDHHHDPRHLGEQIPLDAIVEMGVTGQEPEAAAASAAVATQPGRVVITCNTRETGGLEVEHETDRFAPHRHSRADRPCASVQRFQARNVQAAINKHSYLSGIFLTAGMTMLFDALMGVTAALASRALQKPQMRRRRRK
jgi:hypothetical protein